MPRPHFLKASQISIRTILVATTLVAVCLVGLRERTRYLREHLFVHVVDQATGERLPHFQYQTSVITSETGEYETWSEWLDHPKQNTLTLKVPEFCRLEFRARALDVAGGYRQQEQSILVLPHVSHNSTLRMTEGKSFQSFLTDSTTGEPICNARVVPVDIDDDAISAVCCEQQPFFDDAFDTFTDADGKFLVRNLGEAIAIGAQGYQSKVVRFDDASKNELDRYRNSGIALEPAVRIHGRVRCRETGEPITDCEVVYDNSLFRVKKDSDWNREAYSIQDRNAFHLVTKTDDAGCFELFADSDRANYRVWFHKKGWCKKPFRLSECEDVALEPWPFELAGTVVDESGNPVQDFEIKTFSNWIDVETHRFHCYNGTFRIEDESSLVDFAVLAKDKGIFSNVVLTNWAEEQPSEQRVVLPNGFEITGTVAGIGAVQMNVQLELKRLPLQPDSHLSRHFERGLINTGSVEPDGSFRLNHIADGSYMLVTSYFGHVVNTRPVVVDKKNVTLAPIELPPLGRIRGKVRNADGSDAPFHRTYITDKGGDPLKWFHTNHRGEFELLNVPCGGYGVGPKPARFVLTCSLGWPIDGAILVEPGQTTEFSYERFPIFELHGLSSLASLPNNISVLKPLAPTDFELVETRDPSKENNNGIQVKSQRRATDQEAFQLHLTQGACRQELTLLYRANRNGRPNEILFRPRQLHLRFSDAAVSIEKAKIEVEISEEEISEPNSDDPFGQNANSSAWALRSELYVGHTTVFLLKQDRVMSEVHSTGLHEVIPFHVHDEEPDSAILHNTRYGWCRIKLKQPLDNEPNVYELKLEKGVELVGNVNRAELPLMPEAVRMMDEHDLSLICPIKEDGKFSIKQIWPGKWRLQMLGYDPYLGERILAERELLIKGIDLHVMKFGVSIPPRNN